ncbi:aminopeptidase [Nocardia sp. alder85J]|uniref:aminopeptidase n=1 Tax=Nocardia sp. alder85J TaxID=2862949 RepID=UPI001CD593F5|nr:aminopeptidase [Nocardia sp. alder85J]MCX4095597.1 aminopeptidase [Nocardia sp. alder85J]
MLITLNPRKTSGEDLPKSVLDAVCAADVVISACSRSPYHSSLKTLAQEAGTRGALNSPPHESGWVDGAMHYDFAELRKPAATLRAILTEGTTARVTAPNGTDVTMSIAGRKAVGWLAGMAQNPCETMAWPGGEVSLPPVEGTTNGRVVVEVAMTDIGGVRTPIEWTVEGGLVRRIEGGKEADLLLRTIEGVENARNIGELGIGINPGARLVDDITEAKKRRGTAHIAMGDSANGYGGETVCDLHLDGLIPEVTIEIDGEPVVLSGKLQF